MRCQNAKSLISRSFDERLREYDRSRLEDHLQLCRDCESHLRVLERGRELLHVGSQAMPSENFEWKVQLGIQKAMRDAARDRYAITPRAPFWRPLLTGATGMAALVLAVGLVVLPRMQSSVPDDEAPQLSEATEPDLRGGQPVEIVDPVYVNSRGGRFVSGSDGGELPWYENPTEREEIIKLLQYWRGIAWQQQEEILRLRKLNARATLQPSGDDADQ